MTEPFVRPDVRAFLNFLAAVPGPRMHQMDAASARAQFLAMKDVADPPVGALAVIRDVVAPGPAGDIPLRLFDARTTRAPGPVVMFYHGGGFVIGNIETHASFCAEMARLLDLPVVSVDYRLAPEAPWPAAPDDAEAATRWVAGSPAELGLSVTSLVVSGDSAGGNLAIVVALDLRDKPAAVPVIAQFAIYPAADVGTEHPSFSQFADGYLLTRDSMRWFDAAYQADVSHHRGSPMAGDVAGLPPALVLTASLDPIRDQGRVYVGALAKAGVPVIYREAVGNIHGFITLRKAIPSSQGDVEGALAVLRPMIAEAEAALATTSAAEAVPA